MNSYGRLSTRLGTLAVALGTGTALVGVCGTPPVNSAAAMSALSEAPFSMAIVMLAAESPGLTVDQLNADPYFVSVAGRMYPAYESSCCSTVTVDGTNYITHITEQPMILAVHAQSPSDLVPADAYLLLLTTNVQGTGEVDVHISGVQKFEIGDNVTPIAHYGDLVFFDKGFYPIIFDQIPGFTPEPGDQPVILDPVTDPGTDPDTDPGSGPDDGDDGGSANPIDWGDDSYTNDWLTDPYSYDNGFDYSHDVAFGVAGFMRTGLDMVETFGGPFGVGVGIADSAIDISSHWDGFTHGDLSDTAHVFLEAADTGLSVASTLSTASGNPIGGALFGGLDAAVSYLDGLF